jgi:hypothetical protein
MRCSGFHIGALPRESSANTESQQIHQTQQLPGSALSEPGGFQPRLRRAAGIRRTRRLVFGPVGVHNVLNGLVDLVEDEGAG